MASPSATVMHPPGAAAQTGSSAACSAAHGLGRPSTGSVVDVDDGDTLEDVGALVLDAGADSPEPEHAVSTEAHSRVRRRHVTTTVCRSVSTTVTEAVGHDHDVDPICGAKRGDDDAGSSALVGTQWFCCDGCRDVFLAARAWLPGTEP